MNILSTVILTEGSSLYPKSVQKVKGSIASSEIIKHMSLIGRSNLMEKYAKRVEQMKASAKVVEYLFNNMTDPDTISFGGGSPAKEALPADLILHIVNDVFADEAKRTTALAYGAPLGTADLRQAVCSHLLNPKGIDCAPENILIANGGMEPINLVAQLYLNEGDIVLVEDPTFVQSVEIYEMMQATCIPVECDEYGMIIENLEKKIQEYHPKLIYVIPTFQNPTGKTLPADRRKAIAELAEKYDILVHEDDPYKDIRYSGEDIPSIKAFDKSGNVILSSSFSKILSPGMRLGYIVAKKDIIANLYHIKTATNSFTSTFSQVVCAEFFNRGYYPEHHKRICNLYRERRDVMMECLDKYFPEGTKHTYPDGGLFTWVELPDGFDTTELLEEAQKRNVAYLAGAGFFVGNTGKGKNCMRMSFGGNTPEKIRIGMKKLGELFCEIQNKPK